MATQTEIGNIWHTLGRLEEGQRRTEAAISDLRDGMRDIQAGMRDLQAGLRDVNQRVDRLNGRIDRLFYAIIGMGGALLAATIVGQFLDR